MPVLALCIGVAAVAVAVVAVWWLDRRVLRSGNRWLTLMSCELAAAVAYEVGKVGALCVLPEVAVVDGSAAVALYRADKFISLALGLLGVPLSVVTFVGAMVQSSRNTRTERRAIVVVPFVACVVFWVGGLVFLSSGRGV